VYGPLSLDKVTHTIIYSLDMILLVDLLNVKDSINNFLIETINKSVAQLWLKCWGGGAVAHT